MTTDTFLGMKIIESSFLPDTAPNFRLAPGDYISDEFRARMDAWCDEFFGRSRYFLMLQGGVIAASSHNIGLIRAAIAEKTVLSGTTTTNDRSVHGNPKRTVV